MAVQWQWASFDELSPRDLYEMMALRQEVFIAEQHIACVDADGKDYKCWHLNGWEGPDPETRRLVAHLRVVPAGMKYAEPAIGRVVVAKSARGTGLGKALMMEAHRRLASELGATPIRISAQAHLEKFYGDLGYVTVRGPYIEEEIPHIEMLRG